jgi:hypothetical protein
LVLGTGLGDLAVVETLINASEVTCETSVNKIIKQSDSMPYAYFTEHLVDVTENPPQEYDENPKHSSL